jgi:hypothetical protein
MCATALTTVFDVLMQVASLLMTSVFNIDAD